MSGPRVPPSTLTATPAKEKGRGRNAALPRTDTNTSKTSSMHPDRIERLAQPDAPRGPAKRKEAPSSRGSSPPHKQRPPPRPEDGALRNYSAEQRGRSATEPERVDPRRDPRRNGRVAVRTPGPEATPTTLGDGYFGNQQPNAAQSAPKVPSMVGTPTTETPPTRGVKETLPNKSIVNGSSASGALQPRLLKDRDGQSSSDPIARLREHKDRAALRAREERLKVEDLLRLREEYERYKSATDDQIKKFLDMVNRQVEDSNKRETQISKERESWLQEMRKEKDEWREQVRKERDAWRKQQEEMSQKQKGPGAAATDQLQKRFNDLKSDVGNLRKDCQTLQTKHQALAEQRDTLLKEYGALLKQEIGAHIKIEKFDAVKNDVADLKADMRSLQDAQGKTRDSLEALRMETTEIKSATGRQLKELASTQEKVVRRLDKLENAPRNPEPIKNDTAELKPVVEKLDERLAAIEQDVSRLKDDDGHDILDSVIKLCAPFESAIKELQNRPSLRTETEIAQFREQVADNIMSRLYQSPELQAKIVEIVRANQANLLHQALAEQREGLRTQVCEEVGTDLQGRIQKEITAQSGKFQADLSRNLSEERQFMTEQVRTAVVAWLSDNKQSITEPLLAPTKTALKHLQDRMDNISTNELFQQMVHFMQSEYNVPTIINRLNEVLAYQQVLETTTLPVLQTDVAAGKSALDKLEAKVVEQDKALLEQAAKTAALSGGVEEHAKQLTKLEEVTSDMKGFCTRVPFVEARMARSEQIIRALNDNSDQPLEGIDFDPLAETTAE
ncbi:uncharacterized protein EI97DRAFT_470992 [Westerdykella ornata]|uniref:Uncharacterized protein n=1 Tax=Westerdykella ornata TaxID=318751 RepID=A0A6A6J7X0_WESOR|nr:uncharacterized protein EI97DRAFT_470992 [Westerdykella ornata]KAF2271726.1 hypothetical protein EI97DRAFT_470992 [Westerdykella ornata]